MKKLFYLLFVLPFAVACEQPVEPTPSKEATLELTSESTMTFAAEGGEGVITYNLVKGDEALDGMSGVIGQASPVIISTDADWITINKDESIYGTIDFSVAANTATEERSGAITAKYTTKSFTVTINQAAGVAAPAIEGWAVIGTMTNNWDVESAIMMEAIEGYFVAYGVELATTDSFKFIKDGSMQNSLGGNGQAAERDYKYAASKYGSDIRVKEAGVYDLYINAALDTYYVMSEGKNPTEAYEVLAPGEEVWYVSGLGSEIRMRATGNYLTATGVTIDEDGFMFRNSLTGVYGAVENAVAEIGDEITIALNAENNIMANVESGKIYDIYFNVAESKAWVVARGSKPDVLLPCTYVEGVWFNSQNFLLTLMGDGFRIYLDCDSAVAHSDAIIPAATYAVGGEDGYVINADLCEIVNEDGKAPLHSGFVTIEHIAGGYDVYVDIVTVKQHRIRVKYTGEIASNPYMGGNITNPAQAQ